MVTEEQKKRRTVRKGTEAIALRSVCLVWVLLEQQKGLGSNPSPSLTSGSMG